MDNITTTCRAVKDRQAQVIISIQNVGVHFGCVGVVRRIKGGHLIHQTDPKPYGFRWAARCAAYDWAVEHGYVTIEERERFS